MADETNEARLPYDYYPDPTRGRPLFEGSIYIGKPDLDPQIQANRLPVKAIQEDGSSVSIAQPIKTGAGGVPMLNGSPIQIQTTGEYSIKVLDKSGAQVYYSPSVIGGLRPTTIVRTQLVPLSISLTNRFINSYLFNANALWIDFYNANRPILNMGQISNTTFNIENIPPQRFDLAQGNSFTDLGSIA